MHVINTHTYTHTQPPWKFFNIAYTFISLFSILRGKITFCSDVTKVRRLSHTIATLSHLITAIGIGRLLNLHTHDARYKIGGSKFYIQFDFIRKVSLSFVADTLGIFFTSANTKKLLRKRSCAFYNQPKYRLPHYLHSSSTLIHAHNPNMYKLSI